MYHIPGPSLKQWLFKKDTSFYFHPIQHVVWDAYWRAVFFLMIFKILLIPSGNRFSLTMLVYSHISIGFASFLSVFQYFLVIAGQVLIPLHIFILKAFLQEVEIRVDFTSSAVCPLTLKMTPSSSHLLIAPTQALF